MEVIEILNHCIRFAIAVLCMRILWWSKKGFFLWLAHKEMPLSLYRAGIFLVVLATLSFQISRLTRMVATSVSPWDTFNLLILFAALCVIEFGHRLHIEHHFSRLWKTRATIEDAETIADLRESSPEEADFIMDVASRRLDEVVRRNAGKGEE